MDEPVTEPARDEASAQAAVDASPAPSSSSLSTVGSSQPVSTWPVLVLALPAFVAIWSGWVGLGSLTGFGIVHPLPGIADGFALNTAITLPIGVETDAPARLLYPVDEAMVLLSMSRSVIYEQLRAGRLRSVKQGRTRLIPASAIRDYIALLERESQEDGYGQAA